MNFQAILVVALIGVMGSLNIVASEEAAIAGAGIAPQPAQIFNERPMALRQCSRRLATAFFAVCIGQRSSLPATQQDFFTTVLQFIEKSGPGITSQCCTKPCGRKIIVKYCEDLRRFNASV